MSEEPICQSLVATARWVYMLSVIIPVYNESESLRRLHEELHWATAYLAEPAEVVFVDDGSTDASWQVLSELAASDGRVTAIRLRRNCGKAVAYAAGIAHAHGELIATMDADLQDDPAELPRLLERLEDSHGVDMVIGWKEHRHDDSVKVLSSRLFNAALRSIAGTTLHDHNSGLRVFRRDVAAALPLRGDLHRVIPAVASLAGFRVSEVSVRHRPRRFGASKYGRTGVRRTFRGLFDLMSIAFLYRFRSRPLHFFGSVGLALLAIGTIINTYLSVVWLRGVSIGGRPLLLLGILLMVLGVQFISTGFLADLVIAGREREEELPVREVRKQAT